ncbi:MAG: tRNA uridine-5-carboxymethylaminomethyl(34) synthesis GTPase MnmE [Dethiobacteria bacterium]|nr:tRNA uridine-5-carboxymethylaminomethyl(34) synthesis GTPase MnmE [Bacillota bacterium]HOP68249.1 tRNA uridine-5-carboxymethylaminomethyl(34) synthesis GTPase MnmE [Bacillota bacterium]HPT33119.1 tRNA uridine-5-carboxymethylaminomethyl(34) synthesis GTPase MnmE [Bacillota bacterium]HPZ64208.1 tRNA uridine-5-carboxymethylaminomethyl(34) synthesis GTPase MnmE [Bacillota bacterium]HQD05177.1 tRNA uridine-5-carboxymethylaminomethyl(34) synthesis GTPase MnmE [Bacillota bacterium]
MKETDTIAAISTPVGEGGIGIVRVSGPEAFLLAEKVFRPKGKRKREIASHRIYYGHILDARGEIIDEVLVSFMKAPYTYTREDIVEINCHGGVFPLRMVLKRLLEVGARLAEPGEFTKRAFLNGRIDLSQAESVFNIIHARSEEGVKNAARVLQGALSQKVRRLRQDIVEALAWIEASFDYPEELDFDPQVLQRELRNSLCALRDSMAELLEGEERGRLYQEGIATAIIGKPNVGKSSLLNALLREQRAIVHEVPGTTRDILEGYILLEGYPIRLVDTAGIHGTRDPVEKVGIERSREAAARARLLLMVFDGSSPWEKEDEEILSLMDPGQKAIFVINKTDLKQELDPGDLARRFPQIPLVETSIPLKKGLSQLERAIVATLDQMGGGGEHPLLASLRQAEALREARAGVEKALENLEQEPAELVSLELRFAWEKLGEITGETLSDEILDRIFSQFCVGK